MHSFFCKGGLDQKSSDTATSKFPPAASNVLIATSLVAPNSMIFWMSSSLNRDAGLAAGLPAAVAGELAGAPPSVLPPPGNDPWPPPEVDEEEAAALLEDEAC